MTLSGGEVTLTEPEDCTLNFDASCGSGGLIRVMGGTLRTDGNAILRQGVAAKLGGAVYVGNGGMFFMDGPTKFIGNEVTETLSGNGDALSAAESAWLDATVQGATGAVEIFDSSNNGNDPADKYPGQLHIAPGGKLMVSKPKYN